MPNPENRIHYGEQRFFYDADGKAIDKKYYPDDPSKGAPGPMVVSRQEGLFYGMHWFQWFTNTIVIITCLAVLVSLYEGWTVWIHIQTALQQFDNTLKGIGN
jgi:hypothetical protein